jgi:hypothetical protein
VLLKIVYVLTCRVLGLAVLVFRGDMAKDAGLLVVRRGALSVLNEVKDLRLRGTAHQQGKPSQLRA